jgi:hypothetical protein
MKQVAGEEALRVRLQAPPSRPSAPIARLDFHPYVVPTGLLR